MAMEIQNLTDSSVQTPAESRFDPAWLGATNLVSVVVRRAAQDERFLRN